MSYYDQPIEGRTMVLTNDNENPGYSGDSLDWGDDMTGQYRVYWYLPASSGYGGITNMDWPNDLQGQIYPMLEQLREGKISKEAVNQLVYEYSGNRLFNEWDNYVEYYNNGPVHCIRPA